MFAVANRGAYRSYFQADSIDNLAFARSLDLRDILQPLIVPKVFFDNFRPVGVLFFRWMGAAFGLWFPPYVAALQILHIANAGLLVWMLRRLQLPLLASAAGALFFTVHMALFSVHWDPMYVFDLLCGSLCLLSLIAYVDGRWIVSFLLYWLAYRAKENAIMLPAVFAAYELLLGGCRWKRLIPFFALAIVLGVQALVNNASRQTAYTLHFDPASIGQCIAFYSSQLLLIPFAGFTLLLIPFLTRDRRSWLGTVVFCLLIAPLLALPGRLSGAYLYVPLIGLALAVAGVAARYPRSTLVVLLALWIPWNFVNLRRLRNTEMARGDTSRLYVSNILKTAHQHPDINAYLYHDLPMPWYVIPAAVHLARRDRAEITALPANDPAAARILASEPLIVLDWESSPPPGSVAALARTANTPDASFVEMNRATPLWQLEHGWNLGDRGPYRWMQPSAAARLARPANARQFLLTANISPGFLGYVHRSHLRVLLDDRLIGEATFDHPGVEVVRWKLDPASPGTCHVSFEVEPGFRVDPHGDLLGLSVGDFGFVE